MKGGGIAHGGGKANNGGTRGTTRDAPRARMVSNVRCYRCGLMGHHQYTCTSQGRRAAVEVQDGQGILPVLAHMNENQEGKRLATDIPHDAKKPAVGDGAKYGKSYWLAELEKVKVRWGTGVDANKGIGEGKQSAGNPGQGDPSAKGKAPLWMATGKAPLWMATGKGGFKNMNEHGDGRIVELGPSGEPIDQ